MKNLLRPIVSIITPFKDAEIFIESYIKMVKAQSFKSWECLLINDCSNDNGLTLAETLTKGDPRFHILSVPKDEKALFPSSPSLARNYGIICSWGYYLAFCDIDDLWNCEKLSRQVEFATEKDLDIVVSGFFRFRDEANPKAIFARLPPQSLDYKSLIGGNSIPMLTSLVKKDVISCLMSSCRHEDFLFWLSLFSSNPKLQYGCLCQSLAYYRMHRSSLSSNKSIMAFWAIDVFRSHGIHGFSLAFAFGRWVRHQATLLIKDYLSAIILILDPIIIDISMKPRSLPLDPQRIIYLLFHKFVRFCNVRSSLSL